MSEREPLYLPVESTDSEKRDAMIVKFKGVVLGFAGFVGAPQPESKVPEDALFATERQMQEPDHNVDDTDRGEICDVVDLNAWRDWRANHPKI